MREGHTGVFRTGHRRASLRVCVCVCVCGVSYTYVAAEEEGRVEIGAGRVI